MNKSRIINTTYVLKVQRLNILQSNQDIQPILFQAANQNVYKGVLQNLCDSILHQRPELWATGERFLQHDNEQRHTAIFVSTWNHCISVYAFFYSFITLPVFLIPMTDTCTERPLLCWHSSHSDSWDKTALQHSRKQCPGLLQRPAETLGSGVLMQEEAISEEILST